MIFNRRKFFQFMGAGITFTLAKPKLSKANPLPNPITTEKPTTLLLPEGWYEVRITDIDTRPSRRDDYENFWFKFETVFPPKVELVQVISPMAAHELLKMIRKTDIQPVHDSVELNQLIGKQIKIEVKHRNWNDQKLMQVSQ